jgi:hypothetical protein
MRTWFIVNLAKKRLLPPAAALRQFMIDEGHAFLPTFTPAATDNAASARRGGRKVKARKRTQGSRSRH